jgi:hypothetical protein
MKPQLSPHLELLIWDKENYFNKIFFYFINCCNCQRQKYDSAQKKAKKTDYHSKRLEQLENFL